MTTKQTDIETYRETHTYRDRERQIDAHRGIKRETDRQRADEGSPL